MERERVERLAIDSAAGELNEDAEVLLKEYLAEHREAHRWAAEIVEVYQKTRKAIDAKTKAVGQSAAEKVVQQPPAPVLRWRPVARWAAVVVLAASIGAGLGRWSKSPALPDRAERATVSPKPTVGRPVQAATDSGESFWRAKAIALLKPRQYRGGKGDTQYGNLWERYGQYIKEKSYE